MFLLRNKTKNYHSLLFKVLIQLCPARNVMYKLPISVFRNYSALLLEYTLIHSIFKGALAIRRIFSLVDMITKPKFSNCPNVFKIGLFQ